MSPWIRRAVACALAALAAACGGGGETPASRCALPSAPDTVRTDGAAVLLVWEFPAEPIYQQRALPNDSAYLAYRAAIRADGADLRRPVADPPDPRSEAEAELWQAERYNHELAQSGEVGSIEPITCLDMVDEYRAQGWRYRYALHNHTVQRNGDRMALGNPALSTSDVRLTRSLVAERSLEQARVTNGFYTFRGAAEKLERFRSR